MIKSKFFRPSEKLILTLLVKNEADIILDNVLFHYAKGVDHIIITDNGSTDGTLLILESLQKEGLIYLLEEKLYNQDKLVNRMGEIAKEKYGATILIHADADEFWTPTKGSNLKKTFLEIGKTVVSVDRKDVLPTPESKNKRFPQHTLNIVKKHLTSDDIILDSKKTSLFLFKLPPKVMFSVKDTLKAVGIGNHYLVGTEEVGVTHDIVIFHFPFKSVDRFKEKVLIAGKTMEKVKTTRLTWWHWKRWYKEYKKGTLDKEIEILIPEFKDISQLEYERFNYKEQILDPIKKNKKLWEYRKSFVNNSIALTSEGGKK